jgi:hypothetical protein
MKCRIAPLFIVSLVVLVVSIGCTTQAKPIEESISLALMTNKELATAFGFDQKLNPFIAPSGILRGKPYEFVVFKLSSRLNNERKAQFFFDLEEGIDKAVINTWSIDQFIEFWRSWDAGEAKTVNRESLIVDYFLQENSFKIPRGLNEFYIVLIGKHPLPLPMIISTELIVEGFNTINGKYTIK